MREAYWRFMMHLGWWVEDCAEIFASWTQDKYFHAAQQAELKRSAEAIIAEVLR